MNGIIRKKIIGRLDYSFLLFIFGLAVFGLIMLLSASSYESEKAAKYPHIFFFRQGGTMIMAGGLMLITSLIDYRYFRRLGWLLSFLALICLI